MTERSTDQDILYRIKPGEPVGDPDWTWPHRPNVAGCIASTGFVAVALSTEFSVFVLRNGPDGGFSGK